jgi:uncharacterized protein YbaR (Trm112 family)
MFVPLVDILRCVNPHEETWLVASIERAEDRDIKEGMLGCPQCFAEYPIRSGVVYFTPNAPRSTPNAPRESDAVRLAAALDLTDARKIAVLHGAWGVHAQLVRGVSPAELLLLNAPEGMASGDGVSLLVAGIAPLAQGAVDAIAIDATTVAPLVASLLRSLRGKGRMLGPASMPMPDGLVELARDDEVWVASLDVKVTVSAPVPLKRRDG